MDSAGRSFLLLLGSALSLTAYSLCGFAFFVVFPLLSGEANRASILCLLPAAVLTYVLIAAIWRGGISAWKGLAASRTLCHILEAAAAAHPPRLREAVAATGLDGRVDLVDDEEAFSFAYGLLRPRVAVSRGFFERLGADELRAALEHERYHVRNVDPLRGLIAAAVSEGFSLLPCLAMLRSRYETSRELAADVCAERACGRRALLAALFNALEGGHYPERPVIPSFAARTLLDARVQRLETGRSPRSPRFDLPTMAWSTYGAAAFFALFASTLLGIGGEAALRQATWGELSANAGGLNLACLSLFLLTPALALWQLGRRARR